MEMPKLTEQHDQLARLAGQWRGEETMLPSPWCPEEMQATSTTNARMELDGFFLITDHKQERDGQVSFRGHGVMGWDPRKKQFTMHWFDIMGGDPGPPAMGTWEGDRLVFQHQHHMGHSRYTYEFSGDDTYTFQLENSQDGENWQLFIKSTHRRV